MSYQCDRLANLFLAPTISFLIAVLWNVPSVAQYTTASLGGTVEDPSGAAVPGAELTIKSFETGLTKTATSGADGTFLFPSLPVGTYELTVEKRGFAAYVQKGITLALNQTATLVAKLQVGAPTQEVTVSADAEVLPTHSATVNQLVSGQQVLDLPLNGREAQTLVFLAPGTINTTNRYCLVNCQGGVYPGEQEASVNGAGTANVNYEMDGVGHNDTYLNVNLPFPNPDAIHEFNLQSNNMSAEYGGAANVVNIVTKSGTNGIHGDVFEFLRNGVLNARNFFAPRQDTLKRNQFGGTAGGPILKNRLFFFGTYQGTRIRSAAQGVIQFVPTQAERNGDFSTTTAQLKDPVTGAPFQNNQIPVIRFSQPAVNLLKLIPSPNGPGRQLTFAGPSLVQNDNQWSIKIDYIHGKHQVSGRYFWTKFEEPPDVERAKTNLLAADEMGNRVKVRTLAVNHTYTASPTLLFNTWFGYDRQTGGSISGAPFGFPDFGVKVEQAQPKAMEALRVIGFFGFSTTHQGEFDRGDWRVREIVTVERGKHELRFGGEAVRVIQDIDNTFTQGSIFRFQNALSGNNLADFLLGRASFFQQGVGQFQNVRGVAWSFFAQDNWRANRKLTLNLGLRWDPYLPYTEIKGRVPCFIPGEKSRRFPNAPEGLVFGGTNHDPGCPSKAGIDNNAANFGPRVGFAYRLGEKTVIRGGGGIYYTAGQSSQTNGSSITQPFNPRFSFVGSIDFVDPWGSLGVPNPFTSPETWKGALPGPEATFTLPAFIPRFYQRDLQAPTLYTWNLTVERQVARDWLFSVAYVGNAGAHLDSNQKAGTVEVNPAIFIPGTDNNGQPLSTPANTQSRRIFRNFTSVSRYEGNFNSNYNGLQLDAKKRFSHGLSVLANYTWSKQFDNFGASDPFNREFDHGLSDDDVPHVFHFAEVWQVPNLTSAYGGMGRFMNGWEVTANTVWRSGFPFSIFSGIDNSLSGVGRDRADLAGDKIPQVDTGLSHGQFIQRAFDTSVFARNAIGTFGNTGKNILRGPRFFNTDLGLIKTTAITERASVQFRAEFFNIFNNVNFGQPNGQRNSAFFGKITSASDLRIIQFALKFLF